MKSFLEKYSFWVHLFLTAWNSFVVSWATGLNLPLSEYGIPITINARDAVSWLQANMHIPTSVIALLTLAVNATLFYNNWKKSHIQTVSVPQGSVLLANPVGASKVEVIDESGISKSGS